MEMHTHEAELPRVLGCLSKCLRHRRAFGNRPAVGGEVAEALGAIMCSPYAEVKAALAGLAGHQHVAIRLHPLWLIVVECDVINIDELAMLLQQPMDADQLRAMPDKAFDAARCRPWGCVLARQPPARQ